MAVMHQRSDKVDYLVVLCICGYTLLKPLTLKINMTIRLALQTDTKISCICHVSRQLDAHCALLLRHLYVYRLLPLISGGVLVVTER